MRLEPRPYITAIASDAVHAMYRFGIPIRAFIEAGLATGNVSIAPSPSLNVTPDAVLLVQAHHTLAPGTVRTAKKNRCRIVYDADDRAWLTADAKTVVQELRHADLVTVSTEPLADEIRKRGFHPRVVPTAIEPHDWSIQPQRALRTRARIGWCGLRGVGADDLALIVDVAQALIDEADFVFFGYVPAGFSDPCGRIEHHAPVPLSFFPVLFATLDLDIVLAPLTNNALNECRSNLALLQAGILGYPVLATDIEPHRTLPVIRLPNNRAAWIAAIRERMHDSDAARREGEALRAAVRAAFTIHTWAPRYLALWTGATLPAAHG